jgi:putative ABC transport system permease protein
VASVRGVTGALARDNARRNPRRTARTASALMVGVGVVTLFTVFAASVKTSIDDMVSKSFTGDVAVSAGVFGGSGFSPDLANAIADSPAVGTAVGLGSGSAQLDGNASALTVVDPAELVKVTDLDVDGGRVQDIGTAGLAVASGVAEDKGWEIGDAVQVTFGDGATQTFTVAATYERSTIVGNYLMSRDAWTPHARQDIDTTVLIGLADGVSTPDGVAAVEQVAAAFGGPDVMTKAQYVDDMTSGIDMALGIIYVMLALAIIIAAMGIANTLSLSIHERRRELGLLRAVGQDRRQTRAMVRWESVIVAVFGTVGGIVMGTFLGWGVMRGIAGAGTTPLDAFTIPFASLAIVLVVGALSGVLAGVRPARRAARLDVLGAIASA